MNYKNSLLKFASRIGLLVSLVALWPVMTFAANATSFDPTNPTTGNVQGLVSYILGILQGSVVPLIFAVAIVVFIWGVVQYFIIGAAEEAKRDQGKQLMIWGLIGLAVMIGVWGLVAIINNTFHLNVGVSSGLPQVLPSQ